MHPLSAIRIILYCILGIYAVSESTPVGYLMGGLLLFAALLVYLFDRSNQVSESKTSEEPIKPAPGEERREGMWCRMCGGACDLENCGMEQP